MLTDKLLINYNFHMLLLQVKMCKLFIGALQSLTGKLQGRITTQLREIPAVITGNEFTDYRVLKQPFKPCGMNCQFPVHIIGIRTIMI